MMLDEPYRWAEAVANRRDYIEDQLRLGSPVAASGTDGGAVLVTLGSGQQKVYEVYDRIALAAVGHPTDIEKLRQSAIDLAHVIGFNYSKEDVTLQQIVHFGLGPAMKQAFDEIVRSPFIARLLLAELGRDGEGPTFYTVDYDGSFHQSGGAMGVGGVPEADRLMTRTMANGGAGSLQDAVRSGLRAWATGRWVGTLADVPEDADSLEETLAEADIDGLLKRELEALSPEVVLLDERQSGVTTFRRLSEDDLSPILDSLT